MNLRWAIAGSVLGLLAGLLLFAPAIWLAHYLAAASDGRMQLQETRGTVWNGRGRLVLTGGSDSNDAVVLPGHLAWQLRPFAGGVRLKLHADCCTPRPLDLSWRMRAGGGAASVADGASHWPAAMLSGLGAPFNTLQLRGRLQLRTEGLSLEWSQGRGMVNGTATLDALDVSSRLSTLSPIGSYRLVLIGAGTGEPPVLQLQTLEGDLVLAGAGQWNGARWAFRGQASASPERELVLGNLLNIVGRRQGARSIITVD